MNKKLAQIEMSQNQEPLKRKMKPDSGKTVKAVAVRGREVMELNREFDDIQVSKIILLKKTDQIFFGKISFVNKSPNLYGIKIEASNPKRFQMTPDYFYLKPNQQKKVVVKTTANQFTRLLFEDLQNESFKISARISRNKKLNYWALKLHFDQGKEKVHSIHRGVEDWERIKKLFISEDEDENGNLTMMRAIAVQRDMEDFQKASLILMEATSSLDSLQKVSKELEKLSIASHISLTFFNLAAFAFFAYIYLQALVQ